MTWSAQLAMRLQYPVEPPGSSGHVTTVATPVYVLALLLVRPSPCNAAWEESVERRIL
jgi:hypothetical protein